MKFVDSRATLLAIVGLALLVGCQPHGIPTPTVVAPTRTAFSPTRTPTVVWFPPTATPTPLPTPFFTPTPNLAAGKGALLWRADFAEPSNWWSPTPAFGSFGLSDGVLSLTGTRARFTLLVLSRRRAGYNFYLEASARPMACRNEDAYGVVFRASAGARSYYLFGVKCNGYAFVEKVTGQLAVPQADAQPAPIAPGSLVTAVFSVRAAKQKIYLALNGQTLFTLRDDGARYGRDGVGFFVRPATDDGASAVFTSLAIYTLTP